MDKASHRCELYYLTPTAWSDWPASAELDAPAPRLPVEPTSFRRTWRLAPGLVPIHQDRWHALSDHADLALDFKRLWHQGDPLLAEVFPLFGDDALETQRQVLLGAEAGLRRKLTKDMTLGEALDKLAHEFLKEQLPLVLDRAAFRAAGLGPESPLGFTAGPASGTVRPFWEYLGLVYVPFSRGPVLTTRRQWEAWQSIYGVGSAARQVFDAGVADAIAREQDETGRFVTLGHWLRTEKKNRSASAPLFLPTGEGWTVWEPHPGLSEPAWRASHSSIPPVRAERFRGFGVDIVGVVHGPLFIQGFGFSSLGNLAAVQASTLRGCLGGLRLVLWWPLLMSVVWMGGCVVRYCLVVSPEKKRASKSTQIGRGLIGTTTLWLLFMPGPWAPQTQSQVPDPYPVLLVESEPGKQLALVSPELLKKLGEIERKGAIPAEAFPLAARYQGRMKGNLALFTVQYDIHNFANKAKLPLSLAGVELQEGSTLDGAAVFPSAAPGPKGGYLVDVEGKGSHRLVLSFTVRPTPAGEYQELRFSCPRLCTNLLEWTMPGPARGLQLVSGLGEETVLEKDSNTFELKASLGREPSVHLRWRLSNLSAETPLLEFREAYFWDLRPGLASLAAVWQFIPVKGSFSHSGRRYAGGFRDPVACSEFGQPFWKLPLSSRNGTSPARGLSANCTSI